MTDDFSPPAVTRRLERGEQVHIPSSARHHILTLSVAIVIGVGLLAFLIFIVSETLADGRGWWVILVNLRLWALTVGIIGCLVVAPIGVALRSRRRESLVLSPAGVALARGDEVLPGTLLPWTDIDTVVFEPAAHRGPKVAAYILTEAAIRRMSGRGPNPRRIVRGGFVLSHRRLFPVLAACHARFSPAERGQH